MYIICFAVIPFLQDMFTWCDLLSKGHDLVPVHPFTSSTAWNTHHFSTHLDGTLSFSTVTDFCYNLFFFIFLFFKVETFLVLRYSFLFMLHFALRYVLIQTIFSKMTNLPTTETDNYISAGRLSCHLYLYSYNVFYMAIFNNSHLWINLWIENTLLGFYHMTFV